MKSNIYRQGDVLIRRITSLPSDLQKTVPENGRVILAHGEMTGHAHAFSIADAKKFTGENGAEYFEVIGRKFAVELPIIRRHRNQVMVRHPKHGLIEFGVSDIEVRDEVAVINGKFGLLTHDEHTAHGIPAGLYVGGGAGKSVHQREYHPAEIRRVAD